MGILKKIGQKLRIIPENKTEEIMEERSKLKNTMAENLRKINFTESEINEVLDILTKSEAAVQQVKDEMIGTNINNDFAVEVTQEKLNEVRKIEMKAAEDIRAKIAEIRQRKTS